jgi:hypothetical protein
VADRQTKLFEHRLHLGFGHHLWHFATHVDKVGQNASEQRGGRLRLVQRQPLDEALTATLAGRDQIALVILLNEADRLNAGHDRLAQIATELVSATLLPAAKLLMTLLKSRDPLETDPARKSPRLCLRLPSLLSTILVPLCTQRPPAQKR